MNWKHWTFLKVWQIESLGLNALIFHKRKEVNIIETDKSFITIAIDEVWYFDYIYYIIKDEKFSNKIIKSISIHEFMKKEHFIHEHSKKVISLIVVTNDGIDIFINDLLSWNGFFLIEIMDKIIDISSKNFLIRPSLYKWENFCMLLLT